MRDDHDQRHPEGGRRGLLPRLLMKRKSIFSVFAVAWLLVNAAASGQTPFSNLVFTVGTTIQAPDTQNWSYLVIGSEAPSLLAGKQFAVYAKNGYATNSGALTLRGKM